MDMFEMVGKRLRVVTKSGRDLGLGTYLWMGEILLDRGTKTTEAECDYTIVPDAQTLPFHITPLSSVRTFIKEGGGLIPSGGTMKAGIAVLIKRIEVVGWNHGRYVAGMVYLGGQERWVLASELELKREVTHLQAVE